MKNVLIPILIAIVIVGIGMYILGKASEEHGKKIQAQREAKIKSQQGY